jgi:hypothetical protein
VRAYGWACGQVGGWVCGRACVRAAYKVISPRCVIIHGSPRICAIFADPIKKIEVVDKFVRWPPLSACSGTTASALTQRFGASALKRQRLSCGSYALRTTRSGSGGAC